MLGDGAVELANRRRPLTIIFHDATNSNAGTNKATINSYVAKLAHDRRKQSKASKHCEHDTNNHMMRFYLTSENQDACETCARERLSGQPDCFEPSHTQWNARAIYSVTQVPATKHNTPSPLTILRKGSSDPFNVYAVAITPTVNMLLSYMRDYHLPAVSRDAVNPQALDSQRTREFASCVSYFQDECMGFASLSQIVASMPPNDIQHQKALNIDSLSFKVKSFKLLRQRLAASVNDPTTHHAMVCLMSGAVYSHDFTTAKSHAVMLAQVLRTTSAPTDTVLIFEALWNDNQRAVMTLTRPCFDTDGWIANIFDPLYKSLLDSLPNTVGLQASAMGLDSCWDNFISRDAIIDTRHTAALLHLCLLDHRHATLHVFEYLRYKACVCVNRILNGYVDSLRSFGTGFFQGWHENDDDCVRLSARVQAYASLASIVWVRCVARIDDKYVCGGFSLWKANNTLIARTRAIITETEEMFSETAQNKYARIKLWTLYIGAYVEQEQASKAGQQDKASIQWFNDRLAKQAKAMRLVTWDAVRDVLLGFLYTDVLQPHGSTWFGCE